MSFLRRGRVLYWFAQGLFARHARATIIGVTLGIAAMVVFTHVTWLSFFSWITPVDRIGVIGEFTPTTLPLSIQKDISYGLTTTSESGEALPGLASSWVATDSGKTYYFTVRSGVVWHDGTPVVARDVNYNIKDVTFTAESPTRLKVSLQAPYSPLPVLVSKPIIGRNLKGFGAYKVSNLTLKGDTIQYIKLTPVTDSTLHTKEYRFYKTETQAMLAYKQADIDIIQNVSGTSVLSAWKGTQSLAQNQHDHIATILFNTKDALLSERSVRQALGYSLPEFAQDQALTPIPSTSWAYTDKVRRFSPSPTQAQKLLTSAHVASGSSQLVLTTFPQYVDVAQDIADSWTANGMPTKVKVENALPESFQALLTVLTVPPDPDQYPLWHSTQQQTNITHYTNVKVDKLLEDGRTELDTEKRKKIYADFQRFLVEDTPALFLYYPKTYTISRTRHL